LKDKYKIYTIGCSWSHFLFDEYKNSIFIEAFASKYAYNHNRGESYSLPGHGLGHIRNILESSSESSVYGECDYMIVQLPTPIRSVLNDKTSAMNTVGYMKEYQKLVSTVGREAAINHLFGVYTQEIEKINDMHENVVFFLYNSGGYPFRHPVVLDTEEKFESRIENFFIEKRIKSISLNFEGEPGYTVDEIDCLDDEMRTLDPGNSKLSQNMWWLGNCVHPPEKLIIDAHPNKKAAKKAICLIERAVEKYESDKKSV
tara:strand:+ start:6308 stop:7081 length:774 start_codon:yes stop_codon:yes gene_type:complete